MAQSLDARRHASHGDADAKRRANLRLGLVLASIALLFFVGAIAARYMGGIEMGMSVIGMVALLLLVVAIIHNVRDR